MIENKTLPWVIDNDVYNIWENWDISNRDLIFLDKNGNFVLKMNLTSDYEFDYYSDDIINLINCLLDGN